MKYLPYLFILLGLLCLAACAGYTYMSIVHYHGDTYIKSIVQTVILGVFFVGIGIYMQENP